MKNKQNTIIGLIIAAILVIAIGLSQFFGYQAGVPDVSTLEDDNDRMMSDDAMREHCKQMPDMHGCEPFLEPDFQMENHSMMMDHSSMVISEEAFVVNMIPHHQEAVDTARLVLTRGFNPLLKDLAQNIITAQEKEIAMMNGWVKASGYITKPAYQNMMGDGTKLSGDELDRWFLMGMIMHHQGALDMAKAVLQLNPRSEIADFAQQIIKTQSEEITQMKLILGENMMQMSHQH